MLRAASDAASFLPSSSLRNSFLPSRITLNYRPINLVQPQGYFGWLFKKILMGATEPFAEVVLAIVREYFWVSVAPYEETVDPAASAKGSIFSSGPSGAWASPAYSARATLESAS